MNPKSILGKLANAAPFRRSRKSQLTGPPTIVEPTRVPYGPFRFRATLPRGTKYSIFSSTDLRTWNLSVTATTKEETLDYIDSEAFKFSYRFYRLQVGALYSTNVIGYASVSLPPGFAMIANPFDSKDTVAQTFKAWPNGTTLHRFDTSLFKLVENSVKDGAWTNPFEKLIPGEGAIFFNPTSDYKSATFVGQVVEGSLSVPIPSGFSIRSPLVPKPGSLAEDLRFPITNGDVIHLFDRERQKYVLHPFENGKWSDGAPVVGVGEAFWVAKADPGNWSYEVTIADPQPPDSP